MQHPRFFRNAGRSRWSSRRADPWSAGQRLSADERQHRPAVAVSPLDVDGRMAPMASENLTRDEARERASLLTVDSYAITLDLTTGPETFRTETTLRLASTQARETFVDLIAASVEEIEVNGELLEDPAGRFDGARVR